MKLANKVLAFFSLAATIDSYKSYLCNSFHVTWIPIMKCEQKDKKIHISEYLMFARKVRSVTDAFPSYVAFPRAYMYAKKTRHVVVQFQFDGCSWTLQSFTSERISRREMEMPLSWCWKLNFGWFFMRRKFMQIHFYFALGASRSYHNRTDDFSRTLFFSAVDNWNKWGDVKFHFHMRR